ncbi:MAG TPA: AAA family ATPase [Kineosporiaceae bacterium]|nr:AAA family ATPase [Kineosporiaceae bacterium]
MLGDELVGRDAALAGLRLAVDGAVAGRGRLVLVTGEPGIGKTALVSRAVTGVPRGDVGVLWATCWDGAGAPAYWPWVQVIRDHAGFCERGTLQAQLGAGAAEVARLSDDLSPFTDGLTARVGSDPDQARFRLFDAVSSFLVRVAADRPLCVVLDDLQWADVSSLKLLGFLARRLPTSSLLVIGCYRDTEVGPGHPVRTLLGEVGRDSELVELAGLNLAEVARLIADVGGVAPRPGLVEQVLARTAGNPFFVREVTRLLASRGGLNQVDGRRAGIPDGVREVVERRLARLPQAVTSLLEVAAVAGQEVGVAVLSRVARLAPATVLELVEHAVRARVLTAPAAATGALRFSHDLFRETLYDGLSASARADLHWRIGVALEDVRGTGAEVGAAELAHHFLHAAIGADGGTVSDLAIIVDSAVGYCVAAAEEATGRLGYEDAVGHYQRALEGLDMAGLLRSGVRMELLLGLGNARRVTGDMAGALEDYGLATELARRTRDGTGLARAVLGAVALGVESGTSHQAPIALLEEALACLEPGEDDLRARVMAGLARLVYHSFVGDGPRAGDLSKSALDVARRAGGEATLGVCLLARHDAVWFPGTAQERWGLATEMGQVARRASDGELEAEACLLRATATLELVERGFFRDMEEFSALAAALRQPRWRYLGLTRRAMVLTLTGHLDEAEELIAEAAALGEEIGEPDRVNVATRQLWELRSAQGRRPELEATLRGFPQPQIREWLSAQLALALLARGERDGAVEVLKPVLDRLPDFARDTLFLVRWCELSEAAAALGLSQLFARCYDALLPHAGSGVVTAGAVAFSGAVDHHLGVLAAAMGRTAVAVDHFEQAAQLHERLGARPWLARTHCEWAAALHARARPADGARIADLLAAAHATATALGLTQVLARVVELAVAPVNTFRRDGEVWTLSYTGIEVRLKDAKGLSDLAVLLGAQGREVPATTLLGTASAGPLQRAEPFGADPVLDSTARERYRRRLAELDETLEEADRTADPTRGAAAQAERDFLIRELAAAVGLGGRARGLGDDAERARKAVTARIRDSLQRIAAAHPALGEHLREAISTGLFCRYAPARPTSWRL